MECYDVLILGNGFDLACGYKTSYAHFYKLLQLLDKDKNHFIDTAISILFENEEFNKISDNKKKEIASFYEHAQNNKNIFLEYFRKYNEVFDGWISFEKELLNIVKAFDSFFEKLKSYERGIGKYDCVCEFKSTAIENRVFRFINSCDFFTCETTPFIEAGTSVFRFVIPKLSNISPILWKTKVDIFISQFCEYLYEQLNGFTKLFGKFIMIVTDDVSSKYKINLQSNIIIDFNYSSINNKQLSCVAEASICHVNGYVKSKNNQPFNLIFGFDESEKIVNTDLYTMAKSNQRSDKNTEFNKITSLFENSFTMNQNWKIGVYGHSLDIADRNCLKLIFEQKKDCEIDIYYLDDIAKRSLIKNMQIILGQLNYAKKDMSGKIKYIKSNSILKENKDK